ncbi:MAG: type II toxin-antitoxin system HicA family toxin [Gammaproteobacteria bacterium]|nr:type II toxin-antitoxin system HicA family toxin [Gammaproteobacteria bacterium]MDD9800767.1 type II toxin-antitoxin system HicA family toxin [Gammaproteobacteria bacterium]MDD9850673.1 type II toxin-antitoxin system HicA family toxin [Gammaproteobacteria bacterium]
MKRRDLIRHAERMGYEFLREGGKHTIYINVEKNQSVSIPRHKEIKENTAREILKRLEAGKNYPWD